MATYVFLNVPARGHINPTLPIVKELSSRGKDVVYFLPEPFRELVETAGGTFKVLETRFGDRGEIQAPGDDQIAILSFMMALRSTAVVPQLVESIRATNPDCLVYNTLNLWARLAAGILGVRAVGFRPFHAPREHRSVGPPFATEKMANLAVAANQELGRLTAWFGLRSLILHELVSRVEDLTLVFMPREFQFNGEAFDDRFLFVGPSLLQSDPEKWPFPKAATGERLRTYISLGTLRNNDPEFYRICFRAFDKPEWQVVMSVGQEIDLASLVPFPTNFIVKRSVKQIELLPNVDVFVSHGGLNSTMESLYCGVPLVLIPSIKEQGLTAHRVQELGLGIALERKELTPELLRESARAAACHLEIQTRVKAMQQLTHSAGGFRRATDAIVQFATASDTLGTSRDTSIRP